MRHRDFAVLVAALFLVGDLVFDLQAAGTGFDHLLGHQVGRLGVAESGIDIGNDRHHVGFVVIDVPLNGRFFDRVSGFAGCVQFAEQAAQFAGIRLAQEGVELFDQRGTVVFSCMD